MDRIRQVAAVVAAAACLACGGPASAADRYGSEAEVDDVGCDLRRRPGRPSAFNDNFGRPGVTDPKHLSFVLVRLGNADAPGPVTTDFEASVTFGPVMGNGQTFYLSGRNPTSGRTGGPGSLALKHDGKTATVTLDLQPQPGVRITGTVRCTIVQVPS